MDNAEVQLDAAAEGTTDNPEQVPADAGAPEAAPPAVPQFLGEPKGERLMVSLDDPTCVYGIKDEETFNRVYGPNSRFRLL